MQVYKLPLLYIIAMIMLCAPASYAQEDLDNLVIEQSLEQYFLNFPPYWLSNSTGEYSGLHYRLAKVLYKHAGLDVKFVNTPYQRMQYQVEQGKVAFINYGEVEGINTDDILHICVPPTNITLRVYYLKESLNEIVNIEDFSGQKLIIMHGLPLGEYENIKLDPSISFMRPVSIEAAISGLKAGRGDYFITFGNLMINAEKNYFKKDQYQLKSYPLYSLLGYPIVTPKTFRGGKVLCDRVKESYQQLVEKGIINVQHKVLESDL